jgi:hypothetical protein
MFPTNPSNDRIDIIIKTPNSIPQEISVKVYKGLVGEIMQIIGYAVFVNVNKDGTEFFVNKRSLAKQILINQGLEQEKITNKVKDKAIEILLAHSKIELNNDRPSITVNPEELTPFLPHLILKENQINPLIPNQVDSLAYQIITALINSGISIEQFKELFTSPQIKDFFDFVDMRWLDQYVPNDFSPENQVKFQFLFSELKTKKFNNYSIKETLNNRCFRLAIFLASNDYPIDHLDVKQALEDVPKPYDVKLLEIFLNKHPQLEDHVKKWVDSDSELIKTLIDFNRQDKLEILCTKKILGYDLIDILLTEKKFQMAAFFAKKGAPISQYAMKIALKLSFQDRDLLDVFMAQSPVLSYDLLEFVPLVNKIEWIDRLVKEGKFNYQDPWLIRKLIGTQDKELETLTCQVIKHLIKLGVQIEESSLSMAPLPAVYHLLLDVLLETHTPISNFTFRLLAQKGRIDMLERLVKQGIKLPFPTLEGAVSGHQIEVIDFCIKQRVPPSDKLISFIKQKDFPLIEKLINYGAPLSNGCFQEAFYNQDFEWIDFLLSKGASLTEKDFTEKDAEPVISYLLNKNVPFPKKLVQGAVNANRQIFDRLVEAANTIPEQSIRDLAFCSKKLSRQEALERAKILLEKGAPVTLEAIECIFEYSYPQVANYLLQEGLKKGKDFLLVKDITFLGWEVSKALSFKSLIKIYPLDLREEVINHSKIKCRIQDIMSLNLTDVTFHLKDFLAKKWSLYLTENELQDYLNTLKRLLKAEEKIAEVERLISLNCFDLFEVLVPAINLQKRYFIEVEKALLYSFKPSQQIWKLLYPNFDVPSQLQHLSPYGFNQKLFEELLPLTQEASQKEGHQFSIIHAYKLSIFFTSKEEALSYIQSFSHKTRPYHDACLFELPKKGVWNIPVWRTIQKKFGLKMKKMTFLGLVAVLEAHLEGALPSLDKMKKEILLSIDWQKEKEKIQKQIEEKYENKQSFSEQEIQELIAKKSKANKGQKSEEVIRQEIIQQHNDEKIGKIKKEIEEKLKRLEKKEIHKAYRQVIQQELIKQQGKNVDQSQILSFCKQAYPILWRLFENQQKVKEKQNLKDFIDFIIDLKNFKEKSYKQLCKLALETIYFDVPKEYSQFAIECILAGITKEHFDEAISTLKEKAKTQDFTPYVKIEGEEIGYPGYRFEKMSPKDPMMFILGKKTSCCQSIDGAKEVVLHGATSPFGCFYRLIKVEQQAASKKKRELEEYVAQSWGGITEQRELVFDSLENNLDYKQEMKLAFYKAAADKIIEENPHISSVLLGGGGNTPKNHSFPLVKNPSTYSRIIGYKEVGYDSKEKRYLLAKQPQLHPHSLAPSFPLSDFSNSVILTKGIDTYIQLGKEFKELALNPFIRAQFFETHPYAYQAMLQQPENPLLESGYHSKPNERERFGEMFITHEMTQAILEKKRKDQPIKCDLDHLVSVSNSNQELSQKLQALELKDGQNLFISYREGVHSIGAYIEKRNGLVYAFLFDPESPITEESSFYQVVHAHLLPNKMISLKAKLQIDYYSCTTLVIQFFSYVGKHGRKLFDKIDQEDCLEKVGNLYFLKPSKTPAALLKMAQSEIIEESQPTQAKHVIPVKKKILNEVVSKKNLTLEQYRERYRYRKAGESISYNGAALFKKYKYSHLFEVAFKKEGK